MKDKSYTEKIIEQPSLFDDLMRLASKAVGKGFLSSFIVNDSDHSDMIGKALYIGRNMTYHAIENEIKGIEKMIDENKTVELEIKEPTFDDLIDVAVRARKDKVLPSVEIYCDGLCATYIEDVSELASAQEILSAIEKINSLYTETFVIEGDSDIERLRDGAKITLTNNEKGVFNIISGLRSITNTVTGTEIMGLNTFWLKGATITQKKGNKQ